MSFAPYANKNWIHFSRIPEVKINPRQFHKDPAGIYLFPEDFQTMGDWHRFPYRMTVRLQPEARVLDLGSLDWAGLVDLMEKIGIADALPTDSIQESNDMVRNVDNAWQIMTSRFDPGMQNKVFRRMGYDAIFDDREIIHAGETQLLVLDPRKIEIIATKEQRASGYQEMIQVLDEVQKILAPYGKIEMEKPRQRVEWGVKVQDGFVTVRDESERTMTVRVRPWFVDAKKDQVPEAISLSITGRNENGSLNSHRSYGIQLKFRDFANELKRLRDPKDDLMLGLAKIWPEVKQSASMFLTAPDFPSREWTDYKGSEMGGFDFQSHPMQQDPSIWLSGLIKDLTPMLAALTGDAVFELDGDGVFYVDHEAGSLHGSLQEQHDDWFIRHKLGELTGHRSIAWVDELEVEADRRREGVGTELIKRLIAGLRRDSRVGAIVLNAGSHGDNFIEDREVKSFYLSLGFKPIGDKKLMMFELVGTKTEAAPAPDKLKTKKLYHGTDEASAAAAILREGIRPDLSTTPMNNVARPVAGRIYMTLDLKHAIPYMLGGSMAGSEIPEEWFTEKGRYGYMFVVDGNDLTDVQADEDQVGEAVKDRAFPWVDDYLNELRGEDPEYPREIETEDGEMFPNDDPYIYHRDLLEQVDDGEYDGWIKAGHVLLKTMTDEQKLDVIRKYGNLAHLGAIKPIEMWEFDKKDSEKLKADGSNFFELARKVTKVSAAPVTNKMNPTALRDIDWDAFSAYWSMGEILEKDNAWDDWESKEDPAAIAHYEQIFEDRKDELLDLKFPLSVYRGVPAKNDHPSTFGPDKSFGVHWSLDPKLAQRFAGRSGGTVWKVELTGPEQVDWYHTILTRIPSDFYEQENEITLKSDVEHDAVEVTTQEAKRITTRTESKPKKTDRFHWKLEEENYGGFIIQVTEIKTGEEVGSISVEREDLDGDEPYFLEPYQGEKFYDKMNKHQTITDIRHLDVEEKFQRQGVAKYIYNLAIQEIKKRWPDDPVFINASPMGDDIELDDLIRFYRKAGLKVLKNFGDNATLWSDEGAALRTVAKKEEFDWIGLAEAIDNWITDTDDEGFDYIADISASLPKSLRTCNDTLYRGHIGTKAGYEKLQNGQTLKVKASSWSLDPNEAAKFALGGFSNNKPGIYRTLLKLDPSPDQVMINLVAATEHPKLKPLLGQWCISRILDEGEIILHEISISKENLEPIGPYAREVGLDEIHDKWVKEGRATAAVPDNLQKKFRELFNDEDFYEDEYLDYYEGDEDEAREQYDINGSSFFHRLNSWKKGKHGIKAWRVVTVPKLEDIKLDNLGNAWAYDKEAARNYYGGQGQDFVLVAEIPEEAIDLEVTLRQFLVTGDEDEVRTEGFSKVYLYEILDADGKSIKKFSPPQVSSTGGAGMFGDWVGSAIAAFETESAKVSNLPQLFAEAVLNYDYSVLPEQPEAVRKVQNMKLYRGVRTHMLDMDNGQYEHTGWQMWAKTRAIAGMFADPGGYVLQIDYTGQLVDMDMVAKKVRALVAKNPEAYRNAEANVGESLISYAEEPGSVILPPNSYEFIEVGDHDIQVRPTEASIKIEATLSNEFLAKVNDLAKKIGMGFPEEALAQCLNFSNAVVMAANKLGIAAELIRTEVIYPDYPDTENDIHFYNQNERVEHYLVKIEGTYYDWTASQFNPKGVNYIPLVMPQLHANYKNPKRVEETQYSKRWYEYLIGSKKTEAAKQVGILYHFTTPEYLIRIAEDGWVLRTVNREQISFTRKHDLEFSPDTNTWDTELEDWTGNYEPVRAICRITVDGDKLSHKYSITPFSDGGVFDRGGNSGEFEEIIRKTDVDISDCILSVDVLNGFNYEKEYDEGLAYQDEALGRIGNHIGGHEVHWVAWFSPERKDAAAATASTELKIQTESFDKVAPEINAGKLFTQEGNGSYVEEYWIKKRSTRSEPPEMIETLRDESGKLLGYAGVGHYVKMPHSRKVPKPQVKGDPFGYLNVFVTPELRGAGWAKKLATQALVTFQKLTPAVEDVFFSHEFAVGEDLIDQAGLHPWQYGGRSEAAVEIQTAVSKDHKTADLYRGIKGHSFHEIDPLHDGNGVFGRGTYYALNPSTARDYADDDIYNWLLKYEFKFVKPLVITSPKDLDLEDSTHGVRECFSPSLIDNFSDERGCEIDTSNLSMYAGELDYDAIFMKGRVDGGEQVLIPSGHEPEYTLKAASLLVSDEQAMHDLESITGMEAKKDPKNRHGWIFPSVPLDRMDEIQAFLDELEDAYRSTGAAPKKQDLKDAWSVIEMAANPWFGDDPKQADAWNREHKPEFLKAVKEATEQKYLLEKIANKWRVYDNGRRIEGKPLQNPVIIVNDTAVDGNHRLITLAEQGAKEVTAIVLKFKWAEDLSGTGAVPLREYMKKKDRT